jgi:hypothetical protein
MSTRYDMAEDSIVARLLDVDADGVASPFRSASVQTYGAQMTDSELLDTIENMVRTAPAALVYYASSEFAGTGVLDELATFHVVVVASGTSRVSGLRSRTGVYALAEWARSQLHDYRDDAGDIMNPLQIVRQRHLVEPGRAPTAAALILVFETRIDRSA